MDGCVPDSIRYVPGRRLLHVSGQGFVAHCPAAGVTPTSVANDCTRGPCGGGAKPGAPPTVAQVTVSVTRPLWLGLSVVVLCVTSPRPPPTCPTIVSDVGTVFAVAAPVGKNERLLVRLIVRLVPKAL